MENLRIAVLKTNWLNAVDNASHLTADQVARRLGYAHATLHGRCWMCGRDSPRVTKYFCYDRSRREGKHSFKACVPCRLMKAWSSPVPYYDLQVVIFGGGLPIMFCLCSDSHEAEKASQYI